MESLVELFVAISATVTAFATIALAVLTWVLARATNSMARASSSPNVVASLDVNDWSFRHLDLVVHNTGNASAFDVSVTFTPPLPFMSLEEKEDMPFGKISILRPNQTLKSSVNDWHTVKMNIYKVEVRWKREPTSVYDEINSYDINLAALGKVVRLGSGSPAVQIAEQVKKLREDWQSVARGQTHLKVDSYDHLDRERAREALEEQYRALKNPESESDAQDRFGSPD